MRLCSLCLAPPELSGMVAGQPLELCTFCACMLADGESLAGVALRRAARAARRRFLIKGATADIYKTEHYRKQMREAKQRYNDRTRGTDKSKARNRVAAELKAGRLIRPDVCPSCKRVLPLNTAGRNHTHGYAPENALRGEWLCNQCHFDREKHAMRKRPLEGGR